MDVCLALSGTEIVWDHEAVIQQIIALAKGLSTMAEWLRERA